MTTNQELITAQPGTLLTRLFVSVATVLFILLLASCSDDNDAPPKEPEENPATFIKDEGKLAMLRSMKDVDGSGRLYEIDYTVDYKLDDVLKSGYTNRTTIQLRCLSALRQSSPKQSEGFARRGMQCLCSARSPERQIPDGSQLRLLSCH